ncbi:MAG: sulfotransferase domain-containing protein [Thermoguttaceae bacterium]
MSEGGFTEGDIVVADPFKAGTTWTQRIIQQILSNGQESAENLSDASPWLDSSLGDHGKMLEVLRAQRAQGRRRLMKSHLPADALPISRKAKYVFVGRNGMDIAASFHTYLRSFTPHTFRRINEIHEEWSHDGAILAVPDSLPEFFDQWLENGCHCCDLFDVVRSWWKYKDLPNVLFVHYKDLVRGLERQIVRIAAFLGLDTTGLNVGAIAEHCDFEYMKRRAKKMVPFRGKHMRDPKAFFQYGPRRDFRKELTAEQIERFSDKAKEELDPACAEWLE